MRIVFTFLLVIIRRRGVLPMWKKKVGGPFVLLCRAEFQKEEEGTHDSYRGVAIQAHLH